MTREQIADLIAIANAANLDGLDFALTSFTIDEVGAPGMTAHRTVFGN